MPTRMKRFRGISHHIKQNMALTDEERKRLVRAPSNRLCATLHAMAAAPNCPAWRRDALLSRAQKIHQTVKENNDFARAALEAHRANPGPETLALLDEAEARLDRLEVESAKALRRL